MRGQFAATRSRPAGKIYRGFWKALSRDGKLRESYLLMRLFETWEGLLGVLLTSVFWRRSDLERQKEALPATSRKHCRLMIEFRFQECSHK